MPRPLLLRIAGPIIALTLLLSVVPLAGCPDAAATQSAIDSNITESKALSEKWHKAALAMPDTDSRKLALLTALSKLDSAIAEAQGTSEGTKLAAKEPPPTDSALPFASLVPWGAAAVAGAGAVYKQVQKWQGSVREEAANEKLKVAQADTRSIAYAIDAHNIDQPPEKQLTAFSPNALAQLTPGAIQVLNNDNLTVNTIGTPTATVPVHTP